MATMQELELPVICCAPLAQSTISDTEAEATAALFKALADPSRVRIVNMLATTTEAVCVCEITDSMDLSQPTISFHLKKLVASGLLEREQRGTWAYYSLKEDALARLESVVQTGRRS
jgi:ArsR family transcriptional regulator, arsenate/arsenite/antimonite-responsive transcriptional repressor